MCLENILCVKYLNYKGMHNISEIRKKIALRNIVGLGEGEDLTIYYIWAVIISIYCLFKND